MATLFGVQVPGISKHLSNIYDERELSREATVSKMEIVQREGNRDVRRTPDFYNLDAIISVGYRVNPKKATQFRIWATKILKEYMTKGFVLEDDRLKQGKTAFGKDYFRELLERARSIRASERRIWQQITEEPLPLTIREDIFGGHSVNQIDEYIAEKEETIQPRLSAIRDIIRAALPDAVEKISYQMPTYWKGRNIIHFAVFKDHIGIYPGGEAPEVFADRLKEYKTSKGTIQIRHDQELPLELIKEIAVWCYRRYAK